VKLFGPPGSDPASSVRAASHGAWSVYLTPATEAVCVSIANTDGGSGTSCRTRNDLGEGSALPGVVKLGCAVEFPGAVPSCSSALIYGVVPDGVTELAVEVASGARPIVVVERNAYLVEVPLSQDPSAVSYEGRGGTVTLPVPIG
jgi:hypothetical protein